MITKNLKGILDELTVQERIDLVCCYWVNYTKKFAKEMASQTTLKEFSNKK